MLLQQGCFYLGPKRQLPQNQLPGAPRFGSPKRRKRTKIAENLKKRRAVGPHEKKNGRNLQKRVIIKMKEKMKIIHLFKLVFHCVVRFFVVFLSDDNVDNFDFFFKQLFFPFYFLPLSFCFAEPLAYACLDILQ